MKLFYKPARKSLYLRPKMTPKSKMSSVNPPSELKCLILQPVPDVATLSALIHSSPTYHAVHRTSRQSCPTQATLHDLQKRNIDVLKPRAYIEVCLRENRIPTRGSIADTGGLLSSSAKKPNHSAYSRPMQILDAADRPESL